MRLFLFSFFCSLFVFLYAQLGANSNEISLKMEENEYVHAGIDQYDFADKPNGYWLYVPSEPRPAFAPIVVFNHGYGAYNPMIYGKWIKHLVYSGNIVIFPRYQRNLLLPKPQKFGKNTAQGIRDALEELNSDKYPTPLTSDLTYIGHSYGGVIAGDLAVNYKEYDLPKPKVVMMCSPGTGPLKGGRLESYEDLPSDLKLIVMVTENDYVVGSEFARLVYNTATNTEDRCYIRQYADSNGKEFIRAGHNECYSLDFDLDSGTRNLTTKRAIRISEFNTLDYNGYWKIFDVALDCFRSKIASQTLYLNKERFKNLGNWSDGSPIRSLEVSFPIGE